MWLLVEKSTQRAPKKKKKNESKTTLRGKKAQHNREQREQTKTRKRLKKAQKTETRPEMVKKKLLEETFVFSFFRESESERESSCS